MANWTDNGYGSAPERLIAEVLSYARPGYWLALAGSLAVLTLKSLGMFS